MPDLTGLPALDVLIGMAFLFFLVATVVASINELIQTGLNARARPLARGIAALIDDPAKIEDFFGKPQIKRLGKPAGKIRRVLSKLPGVAKQRKPSYVPSRAFALTVLKAATGGSDRIGERLFTEAQETVDRIGVEAIRDIATQELCAAVKASHAAELERDAILAELERTFDEVMDRASGWYKRYVQWWLLALSLATAIGLNLNAFTVAQRLWNDGALRAAVVQQAQKTVAASEKADAKNTTAARPHTRTPAQVAAQIDDIKELKLPVGWDPANTKGGFWGHLAGWLVTAAAISLGAPFWFDVLGKLSRIRGTGTKETTTKT
jgi:hypothetical protein